MHFRKYKQLYLGSVTINKRGFLFFQNKLSQLFGIWRDLLGENKTKKEKKRKTRNFIRKLKERLRDFM